jgi:hypothetical protein
MVEAEEEELGVMMLQQFTLDITFQHHGKYYQMKKRETLQLKQEQFIAKTIVSGCDHSSQKFSQWSR